MKVRNGSGKVRRSPVKVRMPHGRPVVTQARVGIVRDCPVKVMSYTVKVSSFSVKVIKDLIKVRHSPIIHRTTRIHIKVLSEGLV